MNEQEQIQPEETSDENAANHEQLTKRLAELVGGDDNAPAG